jgi:hypothetical protein
MGLDISAISDVKSVEIPEDIELWSDEYYDWEQDIGGNVWNLNPNSWFPEQSEGLTDGPVQAQGEQYGFRAGSYSGYGEWRDDLARAAGYIGGAQQVWGNFDTGESMGDIYSKPFTHLINFSDADGVIGPIVSEKLYQDFVNYEDDVMKIVDQWYLKLDPDKEYDTETVKWFRAKYNDWKQAFNIARNNGAVIFH